MVSEYAKQLVWELSMRGASEGEIREATSQVAEYEERGEDPLGELGPAATYAETFPQRHFRSPGTTWATVGGVLAVVWIVGILVAVKAVDFDPPLGAGSFIVLGALVILGLGIGGGFIAESRRAHRLFVRSQR